MEGLAEIDRLDRSVTLAINGLHSPVTDTIWQFFSNKEIWFVLYAAVIVSLFIRLGWKKALVVIGSCILCVLACDQIGNLVKETVARLRPCEDQFMLDQGLRMLEGPGGLYGFYSAHAANAMGFAICSIIGFRSDVTRSYKAYSIFIVIWAVLVGVSRVFVGKHFLGDVLAGFVAGLLFGWLCGALGRLIIKKLEKKGSAT